MGSLFCYNLLRVDWETTVENAAKYLLWLSWCTTILLVCLEFCRGIKKIQRSNTLNAIEFCLVLLFCSERSLIRSIIRRIMWLSINTLSVDRDHKKQSAGQDREIQDHVKFEKKKKYGTNLQFYHITFHQPRPQSVTPFLTTLTFHLCFSSNYEFKFTSFLILSISKPGDSYKLLQRQKIQTCHDDPAIIFLADFRVDFTTEFPLITTALLELRTPLIRSSFYPDSFYKYLSSIKRSR